MKSKSDLVDLYYKIVEDEIYLEILNENDEIKIEVQNLIERNKDLDTLNNFTEDELNEDVNQILYSHEYRMLNLFSKLSQKFGLNNFQYEEKLLLNEIMKDNFNYGPSTNISERRSNDCLWNYRTCVSDVEELFAIASSSCAGAGFLFGIAGWGACQGSANLVYYADAVGCGYDYDECAE